MRGRPLYKYRSLGNWALILDIIVNKRLYAAPFEALNDPMEGRYYYFGDAVSKGLQKAIYHSKLRRNICSLSAARHSTLLWSYYADGHSGVAFAVQLAKARGQRPLETHRVTYDNTIHIGRNEVRKSADDLAVRILTQKQSAWRHEEEVRVFSSTNFVRVQLTEILLGCNISPTNEGLVKAVARKWHPRIRVTRVDRAELDKPNAVEVLQ